MPASLRVQERPEPRAGGVLGAALASTVLFAAWLKIPVLGVLLGLFAPFPLTVTRLRSGPGPSLTATMTSAALLATAFSLGHALVFFFLLAVPGLLMGEAMARGRGLRRGCAWAFAAVSVPIATALLFAAPDMASRALEPFEQFRSPQFLEGLRARLSPEQVQAWAEQTTRLHQAMSVVYPAVFLIFGAVVVLANGALLRIYLARRDPGWLDGGEFEGIRWPLGVVVLFVLGGACVAVPPLRAAGYNVLLVMAFFFALQGLAVVSYYARRLAGPLLLRVLLMVLVLLNPWAPQILALLGLFDQWFDFRRWAEPPEPGEA